MAVKSWREARLRTPPQRRVRLAARPSCLNEVLAHEWQRLRGCFAHSVGGTGSLSEGLVTVLLCFESSIARILSGGVRSRPAGRGSALRCSAQDSATQQLTSSYGWLDGSGLRM